MKPLSPDITAKVERMSEMLLSAVDSPDEALRQRVRHASELGALAGAYREQALSGIEVDIADLVRLETLAAESRSSLGIPERKPECNRLVIEFVTGDGVLEERLARNSEILRLKDIIRKLEAQLAGAVDDTTLSIPDGAIMPPAKRLQHKPPAHTWDPSLQIIGGGERAPGHWDSGDPSRRSMFGDQF
jgi:hypothetical protein